VKYIYSNGKFIPDPKIKELGKRAVTIWTGSVLILDKFIFDGNVRKYFGEHNGETISLTPNSILCMESI
jgi:hypothetical protein